MGPADIAEVSELLAVATEVDGHSPLGEHKCLDLVHGGSDGFAALVAWEDGHDHPVGYAQLSQSEGDEASWALEYVVDPHHRYRFAGIAHIVVDAALDIVRSEGGGKVTLWVPQPGPDHDDVAASSGFHVGRELRQLRRALPVGQQAELAVRPFVPGQDEEAWLAVNNRAFLGHDEQGAWDLETLKRRQAQPWFDAGGFLLHERDGRLAGFCWTKIHSGDTGRGSRQESLGELYVIAVDPDFQRLGLGRALALAGLDWLHRKGIQVAMLYVDADNKPALRLYEDLGFAVHHVDRAYVGSFGPAGS